MGIQSWERLVRGGRVSGEADGSGDAEMICDSAGLEGVSRHRPVMRASRCSAAVSCEAKSTFTRSSRYSAGLVCSGIGSPASCRYGLIVESGPLKQSLPCDSRTTLSKRLKVAVEGWWILAMTIIYLKSES